MGMIKGLIGSRKFVLAIFTALMITLNRKLSLNLSENDLNNIVMILTVAIAGESTIDIAKAWKAPAMAVIKKEEPSTSGEPTPPADGGTKP
jgi:hypothetical protein